MKSSPNHIISMTPEELNELESAAQIMKRSADRVLSICRKSRKSLDQVGVSTPTKIQPLVIKMKVQEALNDRQRKYSKK